MKQKRTIICPQKNFSFFFSELFEYKTLFYHLVLRDVLVRYKQTVLGVLWVILRPLFTVLIFTFLFGHVANLPSNDIPYPLLVLSGLVPWQFFADSFMYGSAAFLSNVNLITKIYFPRIILVISVVVGCMLDFFILFLIFIFLLIFTLGPNLSSRILLLPLFFIWLFSFVFTASLLFASLTVKYRDFRHLAPFVIQIGMYASPVGFSSSIFSYKWRLLFSLNPMAQIIDGFRFIFFKERMFFPGLYIALVVTTILFFSAIFCFKKMEQSFADII